MFRVDSWIALIRFWWGDIVAWRSYRDQWLSEGFAEYSGILYTLIRENRGAEDALISELRTSLRDPPRTLTGPGKGRLIDAGPIILGHRLSTSKTLPGTPHTGISFTESCDEDPKSTLAQIRNSQNPHRIPQPE